MDSTREKILAYLQRNRQAQAGELARALGMTAANIRYHLAALLQAGAITPVELSVQERRARGRPVRAYTLAGSAHPNNLAALADALLRLAEQHAIPAEEIAAVLVGSPGALPRSPTQRLNQAMRWLNDRQYQAAWEAGPNGPRIFFRNCPYAVLLPAHPELCAIDQAVLAHCTGLSFVQQARIDRAAGNPPACIFQIAALPA